MNGITLPRTKRGQATFDKLCRTGERLFHEKGYHLTTINDLANESGIASGTFYLYFNDKYSLYRHLLLEYSHKIRSEIAKATHGIEDRIEQERVGFKTFICFVRDNPQSYTIIWQSLQVDKQLFIDYYSDFAHRYIKGLENAEQHNQLKQFDNETSAYALMGIANFVGLQVIMLEKNKACDEEISRIVDHVIQILTEGLYKK